MESARRAPRCARRLVVALDALRKDGCPLPELQVRVLAGGFDQWVRRFWRDELKVERYEDEYWGFAEMAAAGGNSLWEDDLPAHSGYVRPDNQPTTPWSCAGPAAETP